MVSFKEHIFKKFWWITYNFSFSFLYGARWSQRFIFFPQTAVQLFQHYLLKILSILHWIDLALSSKINVAILFLGLSFSYIDVYSIHIILMFSLLFADLLSVFPCSLFLTHALFGGAGFCLISNHFEIYLDVIVCFVQTVLGGEHILCVLCTWILMSTGGAEQCFMSL